jgi:hypothetical protein
MIWRLENSQHKNKSKTKYPFPQNLDRKIHEVQIASCAAFSPNIKSSLQMWCHLCAFRHSLESRYITWYKQKSYIFRKPGSSRP